MPKSSTYLLAGYIFGSLLLLFYSYTQVDLGLTLTKAGVLQRVQMYFQHIGYFLRPISTMLFSFITIYLFLLYYWILRLAAANRINRSYIWRIIILISGILLFSYPAFSHDFFNYMFTAKTVLLYQKNPYLVLPQQFTGIDPWLGFMHWTHAVSAYPPAWIMLTLLPYILGFGYFLFILFALKTVVIICYLITARFIEKSLFKEKAHHSNIGLVYFAFNPLVVIEVLVSGHNDIALVAFVILSYYYYQIKNIFISFLLLSASVALKTSSVVLLPLFALKWNKTALFILTIVSVAAVIFVTEYTGRDIQPWYIIIAIGVLALLKDYSFMRILFVGLSAGFVLQYIPFLYFGHWNPPVTVIRMWLIIVPLIVSLITAFLTQYKFQKPVR